MSKDMPNRWANLGFGAIVFNCDTGMSENGVHPQIAVLMGKMMINPWMGQGYPIFRQTHMTHILMAFLSKLKNR